MFECLLCLALSPVLNTYDSSIRSNGIGAHVAMSDPVYVWGSYESGNLQIVGQTQGLKIWGAGGGYRLDFGRAKVFVEAGRYWPSTSAPEAVQAEIIGRVLRNDHGETSWSPEFYRYDLKGGWGGRFGVTLDVTERLGVFAAYRLLAVDEWFEMCDGDPECDFGEAPSHWQNVEKRSLSSVQIGFTIELGGKK